MKYVRFYDGTSDEEYQVAMPADKIKDAAPGTVSDEPFPDLEMRDAA